MERVPVEVTRARAREKRSLLVATAAEVEAEVVLSIVEWLVHLPWRHCRDAAPW